MYLLFTTDVHGSIMSHDYKDKSQTTHSLSRLSTAFKQYNDHEMILIDNGDVLQGTPLTTYNNRYQDTSIMAKAFNSLNYNYFNLGNHDFNYGQDVLKRYLDTNNSNCLTSNILINNKPIGEPKIYINKDNIKFGLIGVVTDYIPNWEKPENIENIQILNTLETVQKEVDELKHIVDHIIVIYHGGFERDLHTGEATEMLTGENIGYEISKIPEIDVIISGHQHRSFVEIVNDTLCLQCANNALEYMEVFYDNHQFSGKLISSSNFDIDKNFEEQFKEDETLTQTWLDTQIGTGPDMSIDDVFEAQVTKSKYTSFINQVCLDYFKADFVFSSLFNTSPGLKENISMRDLVASYPYPNTLTLIEITKDVLLQYLEQTASYFSLKDDTIVINPKFTTPKLQMYDYDMGDGLSYTIDVSEPIGHRIKNLVLPAEKDSYTMVLNNYRATGGGNFQMIKNCKKLKEDPNEVLDLLYDYILNNQPLVVNHVDNIKVVK